MVSRGGSPPSPSSRGSWSFTKGEARCGDEPNENCGGRELSDSLTRSLFAFITNFAKAAHLLDSDLRYVRAAPGNLSRVSQCPWLLLGASKRRHQQEVGVSLLRIDAGVDTGPVYGHYSYPYDEVIESHVVIQHRAIVENLDALREKLLAICDGFASPINTSGRESATWGQPWLTSYVKWKNRAKRRAKRRRVRESPRAALS